VNDLDVRKAAVRQRTCPEDWIRRIQRRRLRAGRHRDNIEQIRSTMPCQIVLHRSIPQNTPKKQPVIVHSVVSGVGGTAYCTSAGHIDRRIPQNFQLGSVWQHQQPVRQVRLAVRPMDFTKRLPPFAGQVIPLTVLLGTCGATTNRQWWCLCRLETPMVTLLIPAKPLSPNRRC